MALHWFALINIKITSTSNLFSDIRISISAELSKFKSEIGNDIAKINKKISGLSKSTDELNTFDMFPKSLHNQSNVEITNDLVLGITSDESFDILFWFVKMFERRMRNRVLYSN